MTATWSQLLTWRSGPLEMAETRLSTERTSLLDLAQEYDAMAAPTQWWGAAADSSRARHGTVRDGLEDLVAQVAAARRALIQASDAMPDVVRRIESAREFAERHQLDVSDDGTVSDTREPPEDATQAWTDERQRLVNEGADLVGSAMRAAAELDEDLRITLAAILQGQIEAVGAQNLATASAQGFLAGSWAVTPPPDGGTPAEVTAWWRGLTDAQRERLVEDTPEVIGNLDGVAFWARDRANRNLFDDHRERLMDRKEDLEAQIAPLVAPGEQARRRMLSDELAQIENKLGALNKVEELAALEDRMVLGLDFGKDRAQAIIAQGNPDTADHVAVFTPGLTSTVQGMEGYDTDLSQLRDLAARGIAERLSDREIVAAGGAFSAWLAARNSVATMTWLDYQAPQWDTTFSSDNSVAASGTAEFGGADLADFYRGIDSTRSGSVDLTALGHSYGSTTTGYALQEQGTGVDRAGLFGSPGLGVSSTDDLAIDPRRVYYGEAKWDGVGDFGVFGMDPSMLDTRHFETGEAMAPDGSRLSEVTGHSAYLADRSTSQYNLARLVAGQTDEIIEGKNVGLTDPVKAWKAPWNW